MDQVVFARDVETARLVSGQIAAHDTLKLYVARVSGHMHTQDEADGGQQMQEQFCSTPRELCFPIYCIQARPGVFTCSKEAATSAMMAKTHSATTEVTLPRAVEAQTFVWPVCYDAMTDETLVLCRPVTGRTHQIRCAAHTGRHQTWFDLQSKYLKGEAIGCQGASSGRGTSDSKRSVLRCGGV